MTDSVVGRGFARVCLVGGPILVAIAALLFGPVAGGDHAERLQDVKDNSGLLVAAVNSLGVGLVLMAFAVLHVVQRLAGASPVAARVFGFMLVAGMMLSHFFEGSDITLRGLALAADPDVGVAVLEKAEDAFVIHYLIAPFYALGALGLAVVAARSGIVPAWSGLFFAAWLLIPVGILSGVTPIAAIGALGLLIAFWPFLTDRPTIASGPQPQT